MGLANWLQSIVFAAKYCCNTFLEKNSSLGTFYSLLVIDLVCYKFMTARGLHMEERMGLNSVRNVLGSVTEN